MIVWTISIVTLTAGMNHHRWGGEVGGAESLLNLPGQGRQRRSRCSRGKSARRAGKHGSESVGFLYCSLPWPEAWRRQVLVRIRVFLDRASRRVACLHGATCVVCLACARSASPGAQLDPRTPSARHVSRGRSSTRPGTWGGCCGRAVVVGGTGLVLTPPDRRPRLGLRIQWCKGAGVHEMKHVLVVGRRGKRKGGETPLIGTLPVGGLFGSCPSDAVGETASAPGQIPIGDLVTAPDMLRRSRRGEMF